MKLLVFTRHTPLPADDGAGSYLFDILTYLRRHGVRSTVVWFQPHGHLLARGWSWVPRSFAKTADLHLPGQVRIGRLRLFPHIFYLPWKARFLHRAKVILQKLGLFSKVDALRGARKAGEAAGAPANNWMALPDSAERDLAARLVRSMRPDVVLANFCWMNELFQALPESGALRVSLTVDVAHHRAALLATTGQPPELDRGEEERLLQLADVVVAISEPDAEAFRAMVHEKEIVVAPKAVTPTPLAGPQVPGRCLFVGSHNQPNREGLAWFLESVWPRVIRSQPGAHLHVCGSIADLFPEPCPGVTFLGRVADLTAQYGEAELVVVPLLSGSGMKIKLVEAASFGKACVTTSIGLQGLEFMRECVLCEDCAEDLAVAVCRVLADAQLKVRLGETSLRAAATRLSREQCYEPLFRAISARRPGREPAADARRPGVDRPADPVFESDR